MRVKKIITAKTIKEKNARDKFRNFINTIRANKIVKRLQTEFKKGNNEVELQIYDFKFDLPTALKMLKNTSQIEYFEVFDEDGNVFAYRVVLKQFQSKPAEHKTVYSEDKKVKKSTEKKTAQPEEKTDEMVEIEL